MVSLEDFSSDCVSVTNEVLPFNALPFSRLTSDLRESGLVHMTDHTHNFHSSEGVGDSHTLDTWLLNGNSFPFLKQCAILCAMRNKGKQVRSVGQERISDKQVRDVPKRQDVMHVSLEDCLLLVASAVVRKD